MIKYFAPVLLACAPIPVFAQPVTPATDPAALASATRIAGALLPDGTYRKMMSGTFDKMMSGIIDQMGNLPMREIIVAMGMAEDQVPNLAPDAMKQIMEITDPVFKQRMDLGMKAMMVGMVDMISKYEPAVREGLSEAYARRFTAAQLGDLERFFATPSGREYAAQSMLVYTDRAVMNRMMAMMPEMMKEMPTMVGAMTEATKDLPKQRKFSDLTQAERDRIAALLGVDPTKTKK
jgi:hypothetical protein